MMFRKFDQCSGYGWIMFIGDESCKVNWIVEFI